MFLFRVCSTENDIRLGLVKLVSKAELMVATVSIFKVDEMYSRSAGSLKYVFSL